MKVILVIAAEAAISQAIKAILPNEDVLLFEENASQAVRRLAGFHVDAMILDESLQLGMEAVGNLRTAAPDTPLLVLSGRKDPLHHANLLHEGVMRVINKPFEEQDILDALQSSLPRHHAAPVATPKAPQLVEGQSSRVDQHRVAMRWLGRIRNYANDKAVLNERLLEGVVDIFDTMSCALLLEGEAGFSIVSSVGLRAAAAEAVQLGFSSPLMQWFDTQQCLLQLDELAPDTDMYRQLQLLQGRMAMPLLDQGRVFAVLVLGAKAAGAAYTLEERELLAILCRNVASLYTEENDRVDAQQQEQQLSTLLDTVQLGLIQVDAQRNIQTMNAAARAQLGLNTNEGLGLPIQQFSSALADIVLRVQDAKESIHREAIQIHATGHTLDINAQWQKNGVLLTLKETVEEQRQDEDLAYSPFWEYLSSRVAQEVKNPMVAINTFAQLLPRKYDSEEFRDTFSKIVQDEVQRINHVVEVLFQFARDPQLTLQPSNLTDTVQKALDAFTTVLEEKQIKLETHWTDDECNAEVDTIYFTQALHNILQNAVDAMPEGGTLTVATRMDNDTPEVEVTDTGQGIPEEKEDLVFLPFYSTREQGMGLGLTIADRIMKKHQGALKLRRDQGPGSRFALQLPIKGGVHADHPDH